ncbi:hypothetical protein [Marinicellulosiphila megalodicopiae]|uniref:hypothetical protein n=1 Tax=Marinicellulosiphila megalodicopiae TaxID=2724896 RepID=UPI003BAEBCB2
MKQIIVLLAFTVLSFLSYSNDIQETWDNFDKEYLISIANKDYERALEIAFEPGEQSTLIS